MPEDDDDDLSIEPTEPESAPRFRIEANTWEELLEQLREIEPQIDDLQLRSPAKERTSSPESVAPPERVSYQDIRDLADEMTQRLNDTVSYPEREEEFNYEHADWLPYRRSGPGDTLRRFHARRRRQLQTEAGYVWLYEAMLAREMEDRDEAVRQLEIVRDTARLERLAEHSPQRVTRKAALDALFRMGAIPALESAALYIRAEVFAPKKPKADPAQEEGAHRIPSEFYDDTRDHAIDLLSQMADQDSDAAIDALKRVARYDFSRDGGARYRAIRRLGERLEAMERRRDWEGLSMLYRESRNQNIRRSVTERLCHYLEELEARGEVDALLAISDLREDLKDEADAALRRIEARESSGH